MVVVTVGHPLGVAIAIVDTGGHGSRHCHQQSWW